MPTDPSPTAPARRPRWYLLYYILAALDVVTVLASLTLGQQMMQIYVDSVAVNQEWAVRQGHYSELGELASAVNAPGNDVFDTRDVTAESLRMRLALQAFDDRYERARTDILSNVSAEHAPRLLADLAVTRRAMVEMVGEANLIFDHFAAGQAVLAGQRMATMDRKYASVNRALQRLARSGRGIQSLYFDKQIEAARVLRRLQYLVVGLVVLMILGALYYGSRIYKATQLLETERLASIDALTQARAVADSANEAKSKFLANMSHEIRTPLNTVFLTLDMLKDSNLDEEQRSYLAMARTSSQSLQRLIDDVLDLAKIEAGKISFTPLPFALGAFARQLCVPFLARAVAKGVAFEVRLAPELPQVAVGDQMRIGQIVGNLLDNAVKFTHAGSVQLEVTRRPASASGHRRDRTALRFAVHDTGIGLSAEQQSRIFGDFVQVDQSTTRRYSGSGLGLAIARRLATLMGGSIGLESRPGGGSSFWFEIDLPAGDVSPISHSATEAPADPDPTLNGRRILVVEDGEESRTILAAMLRQLGMQVDLAADGAQAVAAAGARRYDAILMDLAMPVMDGFEATRRIREGEVGREETPIVALTAHAMEGVLELCLEAGMDDHVAKPVTRDQVVTVLRRWLPVSASGR